MEICGAGRRLGSPTTKSGEQGGRTREAGSGRIWEAGWRVWEDLGGMSRIWEAGSGGQAWERNGQ